MIQETLEEAAYKNCKKSGFNNTSYAAHCMQSFVNGANWQTERMYSEEEVEPLLNALKYFTDRVESGSVITKLTYKVYKEALEQFKKK